MCFPKSIFFRFLAVNRNNYNKGTVTKNLSKQYLAFIQSQLESSFYEAGSVLKDLLIERFGMSEDNARQVIRRAASSGKIRSSEPFTFGHGQFAYWVSDKELDAHDIGRLCETRRPPIYRLIKLLDENQGVTSYYEALKVTSSPIEPCTTKVSSLNEILGLLKKLNILYTRNDPNNVTYIVLRENGYELRDDRILPMMRKHYSKMFVDSAIVPDIIRWLKKSNLISNPVMPYRYRKTPSIGARANNLVWDACAYTKATGINPLVGAKAVSNEKQTFVVIDVVVSSEYSQIHLDGFLSRVQISINSGVKDKRKLLPIIVYRDCSDEVLGKITKLGFIAYDIGAIFGTRIYRALAKLGHLSNVDYSRGVENVISSLLKIISESGQEESLRTLRGLLFEAILYPLLKTIFPNAQIFQGVTLKAEIEGKEKKHEVDYIIQSSNPSEIVLVELKGVSAKSHIPVGDSETKDTLMYFFRGVVSLAQVYYKDDLKKGIPIKAVFITSGNFWDDSLVALEKLSRSKLKSSKMEISYAREGLLRLLEINSYKKERTIIKKYFK
jgi:hypothetical protein